MSALGVFITVTAVALVFGALGIAGGISFERYVQRARAHGWDFAAARRELR